MNASAIALVVFLCVLCGALFGGLLRSALPAHHLSEESKDVIKVSTGLIATLVALVLGLLIASAKSSFDTKSEEIQTSAAKVMLLDRELRRLGPAADKARLALRRGVAFRLAQQWGEDSFRTLGQTRGGVATVDQVEDSVRDILPANDGQRWLQGRALALASDISQTRWLLMEQAAGAIAVPFLVILVFWLFVIFTSLGLFAPRNFTVYVAITLCALSVSSAVLLILELDRPFQGFITISKEPLRYALSQLEQGE
ncbi:MAG: hypothetical protein ACLPJH_14515 [Myxococcaceae bacterium]